MQCFGLLLEDSTNAYLVATAFMKYFVTYGVFTCIVSFDIHNCKQTAESHV